MSLHFGPRLAQFSSVYLVSLFALLAVCFEAVISGRNNVSVLHSRRIFGLLFIYCNIFFAVYCFSFNPRLKSHLVLNSRTISSSVVLMYGQESVFIEVTLWTPSERIEMEN